MVKEIQYTTIQRVLDNMLDHPLLRDVNMDQAIRYTMRFIGLFGYSKLYCEKIEDVEIHEFRGLLPCDLVSIIQVKDLRSGICLRAMTDNFPMGEVPDIEKKFHNRRYDELYIPRAYAYNEEPAFKTQGRIIYTSFPEGVVGIAYKAIPVDDDGFPLLIDNENYLAALEAYIKLQSFTIKFDTGKISANILQNAQQDYAFLAKALQDEFTVPSVSEMEAITRMINTMIPRVRQFDNGFRNLGDREYLRNHPSGSVRLNGTLGTVIGKPELGENPFDKHKEGHHTEHHTEHHTTGTESLTDAEIRNITSNWE